ncbi:MAG: hypothetical protein IJO74_00205 [Clostridia bacterium]|nr:hypothetical protein [Clostridia bacterium]
MDQKKKKKPFKTSPRSHMNIAPAESFKQQSNTDPLGSYTGNSTIDLMPEQDADDL